MTNHATSKDIENVYRLERLVETGAASSIDRLSLALYYWEPFHRECDSISLLQVLISEDPNNSLAKIWLAYLYVYHQSVYEIDGSSLQRAVRLMDEVVSTDERYAAAGQIVLFGAMQTIDPSVGPDSPKIAILEESVQSRPEWVYNRCYLAWLYYQIGEFHKALGQLETARSNVFPESTEMPWVDRLFETSITGRLSHRVIERSIAPLELKILSG